MISQTLIRLKSYPEGFHLITREIEKQLPRLPSAGIVNLFLLHTSAGLCINENADPSVRNDMRTIFERIAPENDPVYTHTYEGSDDMPAHVKSVLTGNSLSIPIRNGSLALGKWQGIYLCEFRKQASCREIIATVIGE